MQGLFVNADSLANLLFPPPYMPGEGFLYSPRLTFLLTYR
jgi:hypothetical protein